ncbi:MAG: hypothetical protein UHW86_02900 [Spirochaetota bacterium]|nr:hypothetical protein [Spirochaetota bacterium]
MRKLFSLLFVMLCLFGCNYCEEEKPNNKNNENNTNNETVEDENELSAEEKEFDKISSLAYIGGSVVYNPASPETAQLVTGANIAIYMSKVETRTVQATVMEKTGNSFDEKTQDVTAFAAKEDDDIYGYLHVNSVSKDSIDLTFYSYSRDGKTKRSSIVNIAAGEDKDINSDGKPDLAYKQLIPVRDGFENAMCLNFISSQTDLYTTMYATLEDDVFSNNQGRSLSKYANKVFYGTNSHGDFIYIVSNDDIEPVSRSVRSGTDVLGIAHGDYVIDKDTGEFLAVVGEVPEDSDYESDTTEYGKYSLRKSTEYKNSEDENNITGYHIELEDFFTYLYRKNQFASDKGPIELLKALPKSLLSEGFNVETCTADEAIDELLKILFSGDVVETIAEEKGIDLTEEDEENMKIVFFAFCEALFSDEDYKKISEEEDFDKALEIAEEYFDKIEADKVEVDENLIKAYLDLVAMNRIFIENHYPQSPKAIVTVPEISTVYPLMSLKIDDIPTNLDQTENASSRAYSRAGEKTYADYLDKKKAIDKEFKDFYSISLKKMIIKNCSKTPTTEDKKDNDKDNSLKVELDEVNFDLKLGITGRFNSSWGSLYSSLASAFYVSMGANFKNIEKEIELFKQQIANPETVFFIGPVPITVGVDVTAAINLEAAINTPINFAMGFTGLYGGGVDLNATYGIKRKFIFPYPYFYTNFSTRKINHTIYYAGPAAATSDENMESLGGQLVLKPSITAAPKVAIGPQIAYAGIELPVTLEFSRGYALYSQGQSKEEELREDFWMRGETLNIKDIDFHLWEKMSVGTSIGVKPVIGVKIPIINKKMETKWKATTLFNAEFAFTEKGLEYKVDHPFK